MVSPIPSISGSEVEAIRPKPKADEFSPRSPVMGLLGAPLGLTLVTMMLLAGRSEGMVDAAYTNSHWSSPTCPFAHSDGHDAPGLFDEAFAVMAAVRDDDRDCCLACSQAAHAPTSVEGAVA